MSAGKNTCDETITIRTGSHSREFTLETWLTLPRSRENLFPFFADAGNLETITPPWLRFAILTPLPIEMCPGALIEYRLHLYGIPVRWLTEITAWEPPFRFVDEQRRGPYRVWIHEHTFIDAAGGCEMRDFVQYAPPGGWLADRLFVGRNVRRIFKYRARKLRQLFAD